MKIITIIVSLIAIVGNHESVVSVLPILILLCLLLVIYTMSKKWLGLNDLSERIYILGLTTVYVTSAIVFILGGEFAVPILKISSAIFMLSICGVGLWWWLAKTDVGKMRAKNMLTQSYFMLCFNWGFVLLNSWGY